MIGEKVFNFDTPVGSDRLGIVIEVTNVSVTVKWDDGEVEIISLEKYTQSFINHDEWLKEN